MMFRILKMQRGRDIPVQYKFFFYPQTRVQNRMDFVSATCFKGNLLL